MILDHSSSFNFNYNREEIQRQIDLDIFSRDSTKDTILNYLQNPYEVITEKYELNYLEEWEALKRDFKKKKMAESLFEEIIEVIESFSQSILNIDQISEDLGTPRDIFAV